MLPSITYLALCLLIPPSWSQKTTPVADVASKYSLTTSTTLPFPSATQANSDAQKSVGAWGKIQYGAENLEFVADPFPNTTVPVAQPRQGPVLRVRYPGGSFSDKTGGASFFHKTNGYESMMVSYEVAFEQLFNWMKGGKLPGLRGGGEGCSGGSRSDGKTCFSMRLMWRKSGSGEAYGYIPTLNGLCGQQDNICNDEFGVSIQRGSFGFISGDWNRVTMLVQMNNPPDIANGYLEVYYNDYLAISQRNLVFRRQSSLQADEFFFSTFFGGDDSSWAPPNDTHTYYRNIQIWGGSTASTFSGPKVSSSSKTHAGILGTIGTLFITLCLTIML